MFINPNTGEAWSSNKFGEKWREIRKKAGMENKKFHSIRHTVGTRLALSNTPASIIQSYLAHSDMKTTNNYIHIAHNNLKEAQSSLISNSYSLFH